MSGRTLRRLGLLLAVLLFVYGAAVRLVALDARPFTGDESAFAVRAYRIATSGKYRYNPMSHGPFLHYLSAAFFSLFGDSDKIVRLPTALIGIAFLGLAFPLARVRGSWVGLAFLALTALSPTYAFLSREMRFDSLVLLCVSGCFLAACRNSPGAIVAMILFAAAAIATKVTAIIMLGIAGVAAIIAAPQAVIGRLGTLDRRTLTAAGAAAVIGALLFMLLHTAFCTHLEDWNAFWRAPSFWFNRQAHPVHPGSFLYFPGLLAIYEPFICILTLVALVFMRRDPWRCFLALLFAGNLVFYGWAQEKLPNLVLYSLLPATFLAAEALGSIQQRSLLGIATVALVITALIQARVVYRCGILDIEKPWRIEALAYRTMSPYLSEFVERIRAHSEGRVVAIDPAFQALLTWPLRDRTLTSTTKAPPGALRVTESVDGELVSCIWVPVWEEASIRQLLRYAFTQEAFSAFSCHVGTIGP